MIRAGAGDAIGVEVPGADAPAGAVVGGAPGQRERPREAEEVQRVERGADRDRVALAGVEHDELLGVGQPEHPAPCGVRDQPGSRVVPDLGGAALLVDQHDVRLLGAVDGAHARVGQVGRPPHRQREGADVQPAVGEVGEGRGRRAGGLRRCCGRGCRVVEAGRTSRRRPGPRPWRRPRARGLGRRGSGRCRPRSRRAAADRPRRRPARGRAARAGRPPRGGRRRRPRRSPAPRRPAPRSGRPPCAAPAPCGGCAGDGSPARCATAGGRPARRRRPPGGPAPTTGGPGSGRCA